MSRATQECEEVRPTLGDTLSGQAGVRAPFGHADPPPACLRFVRYLSHALLSFIKPQLNDPHLLLALPSLKYVFLSGAIDYVPRAVLLCWVGS